MPRARHRVLLTTLGLAASAAIGASLLSAPAASAAPKAAGTSVPAQSPAQAVAARQQPLLEVADEIMQLTGQRAQPS